MLLKKVSVSPSRAAGAAATVGVVVEVDTTVLELLDASEDDVELEVTMRRASDGTLIGGTVTAAKVTNMSDDAVFQADLPVLIGEALAGAYVVKVEVSADVDLGDNANADYAEKYGTRVDSQDIAPAFGVFSFI